MNPLIRYKNKELFINNKFLLLLNLFIFLFFVGGNIPEAKDYQFSLYEFLLMNLIDHYYLISALLPIMLIILSRYFKKQRELEVIRFEDKRLYVKEEVKAYLSWLIIYGCLHIIVLLVVGILNFPIVSSIEYTSNVGSETLKLIIQFNQVFKHPILSVIMVSLYWIFGWVVLAGFLSIINIKYGYKPLLLTTIIIVILTFVGFNTEVDNVFPIIFFNNFYILHHILFTTSQSLIKFSMVIVTSFVIVYYIFWPTNGLKTQKTYSLIRNFYLPKEYTKWAYIIIVVLLLINTAQGIYTLLVTDNYSLIDIFFNMFRGSSVKFRDFIGWMQLVMFMYTPIFFIASRQSRIKAYTGAHLIIRYQERQVLRKNLMIVYSQFLIKYLLIFCLLITSLVIVNYSYIKQSVYYELLELFNLSDYPFIVYIIIMLTITVQFLFNFIFFMTLSNKLNETVSFLFMVVVSGIISLVLPFDILFFTSGIFQIVSLVATQSWLFYFNYFVLTISIVLFYYTNFKEVK